MSFTTEVSGEHRAMLTIEFLHGSIVLIVVLCATILVAIRTTAITSDLLSFVYGGAISYAGGRAAVARQALTRRSDKNNNSENGENGNGGENA